MGDEIVAMKCREPRAIRGWFAPLCWVTNSHKPLETGRRERGKALNQDTGFVVLVSTMSALLRQREG